jgi:hypothetical protein
MKKLVTVLGLVLVLALAVSPVMADPDADPNPGRGSTDVVVMNVGSGNTDVTAVYYNTSGNAEHNAAVSNLASKGSHRFAANAAAPLGDNWRGSMVVQSAGEVAAVAEILWTNGSSADGTTADAYTGFPMGSTVMYIPFAVYSVNSQFTLFSVQNTEATSANIRLSFVNRNGVTDYQFDDNNIPALGSKNYDMRQFTQLQSSSFWQNNCNSGNCSWTGAVKIESTNGKKITVAATNHWAEYAAAYGGLANGVNRSFVSSVERRCVNCAWNPGAGQLGDWRGFSVVIAQCLSATPCQVRIEFIGQTATMGNLTLNRTINPGAAVGANTRAGGDFAASDFNVLRNSTDPAGQAFWAGSAVVSTTNGTNVAVINYSLRPDINIAAGNAGAGAANGGTQTYVPTAYKVGTCDGGFNWQKLSIVRIQNPTTNNASNVSIAYYNRNGVLAFQETGLSIPAGQSLSRNTRVNCSQLAALGNNWEGSIFISSNQPLVATAETYQNAFGNPAYGASWAAGYNAYSVTP